MKERVMTDPKQLVKIELKNAGFDIDSINVVLCQDLVQIKMSDSAC